MQWHFDWTEAIPSRQTIDSRGEPIIDLDPTGPSHSQFRRPAKVILTMRNRRVYLGYGR